MESIAVTAFYIFSPVSEFRIPCLRDDITQLCEDKGVRGLFLLAPEGCNATLSGPKEAVEAVKEWVRSQPEFKNVRFKDSRCSVQPFRRFKVDLRREIVTLNREDLVPVPGQGKYLSPSEWHELVTSEEEFTLIDTRNDYEIQLGQFPRALNPGTAEFGEFSKFVAESDLPKDKKILMYCTGGIRCEKASLLMAEAGFQNVYQLDGGILGYFQEFPEGAFEGECFVFDHRVSVDTKLQPSKIYKLCPHCGNPGKERISCGRCSKATVICKACAGDFELNTCSKDCSYHLRKKAS